MGFDGVLFDLDGTLWNATQAIGESWRIALKDFDDVTHCPTVPELEGVMGMTAEQLMATLFPEIPPERAQEIFERCCEVEDDYLRAHGGQLYPGLEEMLMTLSQTVPLAVVSNCNIGYIPAFLDAHNLGKYFRDWECIGRTGLQKWENIRLVAERNHMEKPVYVGDTEMDRAAAKKAGVPFIHAAYGFGKAPGAAKIETPMELCELLDK